MYALENIALVLTAIATISGIILVHSLYSKKDISGTVIIACGSCFVLSTVFYTIAALNRTIPPPKPKKVDKVFLTECLSRGGDNPPRRHVSHCTDLAREEVP